MFTALSPVSAFESQASLIQVQRLHPFSFATLSLSTLTVLAAAVRFFAGVDGVALR